MKRHIVLAKKIIESNFKYLDFPYKLTLITTYNCNSKCLTCNIWKIDDFSQELKLEEYQEFFKKSNEFSWVDISGGEIFLRKDIVELAKAITDNCKNLYMLHFPTNSLLPKRVIEKTKEILELKPNKLIVTVSLDGNEGLHDKIRGVKGNFEKCMQTYEGLKSMGVETYFGFTLSNYNLGMIDKTFEAVKRRFNHITWDDFHMNISNSSDHYYGIKMRQLTTAEVVSEVNRFIQKRGIPRTPVQILEYRYLSKIEEFLKTRRTPVTCKALSSSCFLDPKGDVYPCNSFSKVMGNIRNYDYDLRKIWNLPSTQETREGITKGKCPHCWTPCEAYQSLLGNLFNQEVKHEVIDDKPPIQAC
ncbi:radical SAM protein [Candidatus Woesearchaeota archaeon]|nr:radical SAM protein [Candidatus Woesearchaeota archaeon]